MRNIFISEWERALKRKKTIIVIGFYILLVLFECLFLLAGTSFYDADHSVQLNSLNTAPFFLRELGLFINLILVPMFVVDSFNGEYRSGALRMALIRPQSRVKLFFAKWSVQVSILLLITAFTWLTATIFGKLFMPSVQETTFLNTGMLGTFGANMFTLKFYGISLFISVIVITLGSLVSIIMPNMIISYIVIAGILVGSIYISDIFVFFILVSDAIFEQLGSTESLTFYLLLVVLFAVSYIMNIVIWKKREWMD